MDWFPFISGVVVLFVAAVYFVQRRRNPELVFPHGRPTGLAARALPFFGVAVGAWLVFQGAVL